MSINDAVIPVNEVLDTQAQRALEDRIREVDGVIEPRFNDHRPPLMIVACDPDHTRIKEFIDVVQKQGYHAQHCGAWVLDIPVAQTRDWGLRPPFYIFGRRPMSDRWNCIAPSKEAHDETYV